MEEFNKRLKRLRIQKGYTIKSFAKKIGVPVSTYREWEYGRLIRGSKSYEVIAKVLGVSLANLLTGISNDKQLIIQKIDKLQIDLAGIKEHLLSLF